MLSSVKSKIKSILQEREYSLEQPNLVPSKYPLVMSQIEKAYMQNLFKCCGGGDYLEFGSGGSTFLALLHSQMKITSIESSLEWITYLRKWHLIAHALEEKRLNFHHIDIGRVGAWGTPLDTDRKESFPNYSSQIFQSKNDFNIVFIDGRFRVACVLATLLYCNPNTKILIHDFNNRPQYHKIVEFLDFIDTCDSLAEFKPKDKIDRTKLLVAYEAFKYNYE